MWELTQEDTRRRVCGCVSQGTGGGRTWSAADCQTALSASHTRLATMFPPDVRLFTGCVLFPRYRWTQGMVAGAKESEGGARHTGGGVRRFGQTDTLVCVLAARMGLVTPRKISLASAPPWQTRRRPKRDAVPSAVLNLRPEVSSIWVRIFAAPVLSRVWSAARAHTRLCTEYN